MICIASSTGVMMRWKRSERPGADAERHPDREREADGGEHQRERLHALEPEPAGANATNAASAQIAARAPPKRSETSTPATVTPTQVIQPSEVGEPGHEIVEEGREAVEGSDHDARVLRVALVDEPRLEVVEVRRQRVPGRARPATGTRTSSAR